MNGFDVNDRQGPKQLFWKAVEQQSSAIWGGVFFHKYPIDKLIGCAPSRSFENESVVKDAVIGIIIDLRNIMEHYHVSFHCHLVQRSNRRRLVTCKHAVLNAVGLNRPGSYIEYGVLKSDFHASRCAECNIISWNQLEISFLDGQAFFTHLKARINVGPVLH